MGRIPHGPVCVFVCLNERGITAQSATPDALMARTEEMEEKESELCIWKAGSWRSLSESMTTVTLRHLLL